MSCILMYQKKFSQLKKLLATKINLFIYLFIYQGNIAINTITNIKLILHSKIKFINYYKK